jgi:hypothetical protein
MEVGNFSGVTRAGRFKSLATLLSSAGGFAAVEHLS